MTKKIRKSKTIGINVLAALILIVPESERWIVAHPRATLLSLISANIVLRFLTKDRIRIEVPMMKKILTALIIGFALVAYPADFAWSFGNNRVQADPQKSAIEADDMTGLIEGCGRQAIAGFDYCRKTEGDAADQSIAFIGPPAKCSREDACVFVKVWNAQGSVAWGGSIPKGKTRVSIPWKTLLGSDKFTVGHRGFWTYVYEVLWVDQDGRDRVSKSQGEIVLRVNAANYIPLDRVEDDPNFVWIWAEGDQIFKMTTGLRAFTGRAK